MDERRPARLPEDPTGLHEPHDVLAADEFAMPMRSRGDIPPDPIHEPHDVLAAEEFAMPTGGVPASGANKLDPRSFLPGAGVLVLLLLIVRRLRR